nr:hypothetical protein [Tanacetum cinerariifolium]
KPTKRGLERSTICHRRAAARRNHFSERVEFYARHALLFKAQRQRVFLSPRAPRAGKLPVGPRGPCRTAPSCGSGPVRGPRVAARLTAPHAGAAGSRAARYPAPSYWAAAQGPRACRGRPAPSCAGAGVRRLPHAASHGPHRAGRPAGRSRHGPAQHHRAPVGNRPDAAQSAASQPSGARRGLGPSAGAALLQRSEIGLVVQRQRGARRSQRLMRRVLPFVASLFLATPLAGPVARSLAKTSPAPTPKVMVAPLSRLESTAHDLYTSLVAHGHNSGENEANNFSNTDQSNMSSLGFYVTGQEYEGKHGHSLRLQGVDEGFNTNAAARAVVMHGADYVSEAFIKQNGRLGRSLGCPALPLDQYSQIIDAVHGGSCLFLNKSNAGYSSKYLNEAGALMALNLNAPGKLKIKIKTARS